MAKLPRIPSDIKEQIYTQLNLFGGIREKAFVKYAAASVIDTLEDKQINSIENLGYKVLNEMVRDGLVVSMTYGMDHVVVPSRDTERISFEMMDAFEAFIALIYEQRKNGCTCEFSHAMPAEYPFDSVFSISGDGMYRVIVLNNTAMGRINFFNSAKTNTKGFTTLLVISSNYTDEKLEAFFELVDGEGPLIKGKSRMALITRNKKNFDCQIGPLMGEEKA